MPIANGGVTAGSNTTMSIVLALDLDGLFSGLDFATADVVGGEISIDATNNLPMLIRFEQNLAASMDVEEGEN